MGCLRRLTNCLATIIVLAAVLAVGAYLLLLYVMENELADALKRKFMLPPSASVTVDPGDILDSIEGRVDSIHIRASEALVSGIRVENIAFDAEDLSFDVINLVARRNPVLREVAYAEASFEVSPQDLADAWLKRAKRFGVRDLSVEFIDDEGELPAVKVTASTRLLGKDVEVSVQGRFELVDQREIAFQVSDQDAGADGFGREVIEGAFMRMSPRLRVGDFQGDLVVDRLWVEDGKLHITAHTSGVASLDESTESVEEDE